MIDEDAPVSTISSQDVATLPSPNSHGLSHPQLYHHVSTIEEAQDDDGQISCICGFNDDDGNTVACDGCNRWQHTLCYYPQYEGRNLPDELQHYCLECRPKPFDAQAALHRQMHKREQQDTLLNGLRRPPAKNPKKKVREGNNHVNGWAHEKNRHDRKSDSPRDQPPPAKRPKTMHRASDSSTNIHPPKGHSRKRTASNINHSRASTHSPERAELYSPEFIQCYQHDSWTVTHANLHNDISVTNELADWLHAPDNEFRATHGCDKRSVLMRWDGQLDDIPGKAQIDVQEYSDNHEGLPGVSWKTIVVKEPVAQGAYIGELKGRIGLQQQYKDDPANRWSHLRHPEPFVFFYPSLPIYIDARNEGTELRYVRRSCKPNAKLQILVTNSTDYHFCIMAQDHIEAGSEVAVSWDTTEINAHGVTPKELEALSAWVSNVLANCGPCACDTINCPMSRFDRRRGHKLELEDKTLTSKASRPKKKKGAPNRHASPFAAQVALSRSGSENRKVDLDDEQGDVRSTSGSGHGSISRDITPGMYSLLAGGTEISERERKKLAKEEEMFRRQAEEQMMRQGKKKRNSAGSSTTASHPPPPKLLHSSSSRVAEVITKPSDAVFRGHRRPKGSISARHPKTPSKSKVSHATLGYVSTGTQVDVGRDNSLRRSTHDRPQLHRFVSKQQYLLRYLAQKEMQSKSPPSPPSSNNLFCGGIGSNVTQYEHVHDEVDAVMVDVTGSPATLANGEVRREKSEDEASESPTLPAIASPVPLQPISTSDDIPMPTEMKPLPSAIDPSPTLSPYEEPAATITTAAHLNDMEDVAVVDSAEESVEPAANADTTSNVTSSLGPIFSPSVAAAVTPNLARKKLSLSDYTRRSKAKDRESDVKPERDQSPGSTASGPTASSVLENKALSTAVDSPEDTPMTDVPNDLMTPSKS